jgi:hypothetical protein
MYLLGQLAVLSACEVVVVLGVAGKRVVGSCFKAAGAEMMACLNSAVDGRFCKEVSASTAPCTPDAEASRGVVKRGRAWAQLRPWLCVGW